VGEGEVELEDDPRQGVTVFQVSFLIIGSLIFLNVLIAMMSKTCASESTSQLPRRFPRSHQRSRPLPTDESINDQAEVLSTIERARLIREVEKDMSPAERLEPAKWFRNRVFKQQDPSGQNGGVQYWCDWAGIIPPPTMHFKQVGPSLVLPQGEESLHKAAADSNNAHADAIFKQLLANRPPGKSFPVSEIEEED
jgi:hypothetical protein